MRWPLSVLAPEGLFLLLSLLPLVLLYVLKVKRARLRVSSTFLWASARRDLLARSPFRRLVATTPLFLQAAALLFFSLALAQVVSRSAVSFDEPVAIVVDTSASMGALGEGGQSRIALAREAAQRIASNLRPDHRALLIESGREASVRAGWGDDRRRLRAAIDALEVSDVEGDLGKGLGLATERLRQEGGGRILVITDLALARSDAFAEAGMPVDIVKVGGVVDNVGIVRTHVRAGKGPDGKGEQAQVFAMLESFGARPREVFVTLRLDHTDDILASRRLRISPGERLPVELAFPLAPGDSGKGLVVELSPNDAFATDDSAYLRLPSAARLPVILAGTVSPFVARAFTSDPEVDAFRAKLEDLGGDALPQQDALVVVESACPAPSVDALALLVLNPPAGDCLGVHVGEPSERPTVTSWAEADPRLRFLSLDDLHIARASILEPTSTTQALVRTREGAILADASGPGRDVTIVGFDVGESNWPLKASFVLFARNLAEQARARRSFGVASEIPIGEPLRLELPKSALRVRVEGPHEFRAEAPVHDGLAVLAGLNRAGFYHVSFEGRRSGSALIAANLASSRESDLRERPVDTQAPEVSVAEGRVADRYRDWSWIFALLALAFLAADVAWLTRKPRPRRTPGPATLDLPSRRQA